MMIRFSCFDLITGRNKLASTLVFVRYCFDDSLTKCSFVDFDDSFLLFAEMSVQSHILTFCEGIWLLLV
jgi:hypothetical protein